MDVRLDSGANSWTMRALVDTGSPITFFDRGAADAIGVKIELEKKEKTPVRILGGTWDIQFEFIDLTLVVESEEVTWHARVAFAQSPRLQMPFQGVLGTEGFLDKFAVTFNKYYDYFVVEQPDDFHDRVVGPMTEDPASVADESWRRGGGSHFRLGRRS